MLRFRFATEHDINLYFEWANDYEVRKNSLSNHEISYETHVIWFTKNINNPNVFMYLFSNEMDENVGQVRIEKKDEWVIVSQSVAKEHRGKKYSTEMLFVATNNYLSKFPANTIVSIVKKENTASLVMAEKSGFKSYGVKGQDWIIVLKGHRENDPLLVTEAAKFYELS
jgi:spore coat polysaccharide biosynthesis protein SpsF